MSMLAERRQRKRYHLVPRGKALYEDDNRFGTRMLKKMGWSEGKGLGAKEDGNQEFIRVKYKHDSVGFGFEDRDDQWTQHEQHFNGLLKSLGNYSEDDSNSKQKIEEKQDDYDTEVPSRVGFGFQKIDDNDDDGSKSKNPELKFSGESLEKKSKESKARVHYKKFTRGKDLTRYSEKDLANIFGKKSLNDKNENKIQLNDENEKLNLQLDKNSNSDDMKFGVITKKSEKSLEVYFNERIKKLKRTKNDCDDDYDDRNPKKMKIENETMENSLMENLEKAEEINNENMEDLKKKKKKYVSDECKNADKIQEVICVEESPSEATITKESTVDSKKKKRNKEKRSDDNHEKKDEVILINEQEVNENFVLDNEENSKKNKKSKRKNVTEIDERCNKDDGEFPKKSSKKYIENFEPITNDLNKIENKNEKKKKNKSKKNPENSQKNEYNEENSIVENQIEILNKSNSANNDENLMTILKTNAFVLEKFRNVELDKFNGSNIKDICGYGFAENFEIEIEKSDSFAIEKLLKLWDDVETMKQKYDYKKNNNEGNKKNQENFTGKKDKNKNRWKKKRKPIKLFSKI